jgi:hypothetical protein
MNKKQKQATLNSILTQLDNIKSKLNNRSYTALKNQINNKSFNKALNIQKQIKILTTSKSSNLFIKDFNNEIKKIYGERINKSLFKNIKNRYSYVEDIKKFNNNIITDIEINNITGYKLKNIIKSITGKALLKSGNKIFVLSNNNKNILLNSIDKLFINNHSTTGSDEEFIAEVIDSRKVSIKKAPENFKKKLHEGGFFPYYNITELDLTEFQIFNNNTEINYIEKNNRDGRYVNSCFINSLIQYGVKDEIIQKIKLDVKTRDLPQKLIKFIAEKYKLHITVKKITDAKYNVLHYGDKQHDIIPLGLIENHYFIIKDVKVNSYALKNYFELYKKDADEWFKYRCSDRKKELYISSYEVIKILVENKNTHLINIPYSDLYKTEYYNTINEITVLDYNENDDTILSSDYYNNKFTQKDEVITVFFDFETITEGEQHIPYVCVANDVSFRGENCGLDMLIHITNLYKDYKVIRLIAHNAGYDFRFIYKYLHRVNLIERGKMLLRGNGYFYNRNLNKDFKLEIQDSYSLISSPLSGFGKMFLLECRKEILPYSMYNKINVDKQFLNKEEIKPYLKSQVISNNNGIPMLKKDYDDYADKFYKNVKDWDCETDDGKIDIIKYSECYCFIDVDVLTKGYNTFKKWILEVCNLNIDNFVSLPSLANAYMVINGVYDGVYLLSGTPRAFIQKCMVGGRTMISNNKKCIVNKSVDDFDAVSLYPSAMERLGGVLKGRPKIITDLTYECIKNTDGYFIEIIVNEVNKKYKFPLMSNKDDDGIRVFSNQMIGQTLFVDKNTLEDLIEFHEIKFTIIRGYYYDEGRNYKLKDTIRYLFDKRKEQKSLKNPIEQVYKLLMNSAYGKTLLKPFEYKIEYKNSKEIDDYVSKYYNYIAEYEELPNKTYRVKVVEPINKHFNMVHIGVEILSMSKRIMNEVMCLAENNNINMYYQDTDSIHIDTESVNLLSKLFKQKYNRDLIGNDMGQFHSDFNAGNLKGEIHSIQSIYLGKKMYIDKLKGDGDEYEYHIRMKGVSKPSILYECYKQDITPIELYEKIYNGISVKFDLCCGGYKISFDFINIMNIMSKNNFSRVIKIDDNADNDEEYC